MATTEAADGAEIHYLDSGTGEGADGTSPVVLVHGITENRSSWDPIIERLSPDRRVVALDLRGHGDSGTADRYDLEAMAGDVIAVTAAAGLDRPHLVGHSLGGAVVSAVGAVLDVASIVNVDQSLRLGSFKEQLMPAEPMLRDPGSFDAVIRGLFSDLYGPELSDTERTRLDRLRRPDQTVVLGVWDLIFSASAAEIAAVVGQALAAYRSRPVRYLSLFGSDPGPDYQDWLAGLIADAIVEVWPGTGHYPHLVRPDEFVRRLESFWA